MMSATRQFLDLAWTVLCASVLKGVVVFLVAFVAVSAARKLPAAHKQLVWFFAILSCLAIPLAWLFLPTAQMAVPIPQSTTNFDRILTAPLVSRAHYQDLVAKSNAYAALSGQHSSGSPAWWQLWFVAVWVAGTAALLIRGVAARRGLRCIAASAETDSRRQSYLDDLRRRFGIGKEVTVLISGHCAMPFTFGVTRPRIVLPRSARSWTHGRLKPVLIHELSHIRCRDYLISSLAQIVCALFWFVPYLWVAYARMLREGENKCDSFVIDEGVRGTEYAGHLVEIVQSCRGHVLLPTTYPTIGRKYMLQRRIQSILSLKPHHLRENSRTAGLLLGVCLCCVLPLFAVTCATRPYAPGAEEPLYGTWVNEEYATLGLVRSDTADVKYVFAAAGKFYMYASTSDPAPKFEGRLAFDDKWIDKQGNVYYKAVQTWRYYPYDEAKTCPQCPPCYVLYRVNAAGDMLESVSNQLGYPEEFSHVAGWYMVHYRPRGR